VQEQVDRFLHYLKDEKDYSSNTIAAYRNDLRQFVSLLDRVASGAVGSWSEVDHQLIAAYGEYLEEQTYAPSTVARKVASVKSFFSFMIHSALLTDNPTTALSAPKIEKQLPRIMSEAEVERLLAQPVKGRLPKALRDRALLELLYATGMRVSEAIALQLDDLDLAATCVFGVGRDGKKRQLPLPPQALEALSAYLEKGRDALLHHRLETTLFVNQRGRPLTRQGLWLIIKSYAEAADLGPGVTPHTLRHSCAAHRLARGGDLHQVRELLGHANLSTTQVYVDIANPRGEESDAVPG
jgi:integrase/recombinase XerD